MGCGEDRHEHIGFEAFLIFFFGLGGHKLLHIFSTDVNGSDVVGWFIEQMKQLMAHVNHVGLGLVLSFLKLSPKAVIII